MAKMKSYTLEQIKEKSCVTVGNNRTISVNEGVFCCFLHGHEIAQFEMTDDPHAVKVSLDHCGWQTTTTRQAMKDFLEYFGVMGSVSFAKGKFSVRYRAVDCRYHEIDDAPRNVTFYAGV